MFWQSKRLWKWPFRCFSRTLRHEIEPTAYSGCQSVRRNGPSAGFCGHYDTKSGLQRIMVVEASAGMALPLFFADTTTRNRAYSMFWLTKRPGKWPFRWFLRTLRHRIGPTACPGCPSVRRNSPSAVFPGRYDTKSALQRILAVQASVEMALPLVFADATTRNQAYSVFWLSKRPGKWPFHRFFRTLRHEIRPTACSGCLSVRGNGPSAGFFGRYDTKSALQRILVVEASTKMARTTVFADTTTRNQAYSVFWLSKRPGKWPFRWFLRTLRHEIGPTAYSDCPSVRRNGPSAGFCGRYDTKSGLQRVLAVEASGEMAIPPVFSDATTQNRAYSVFWLSKRPGKWQFRWFLLTLRHEIGPTAYSGCPSVRGNGRSAGFCGHYDTESGLQHVLAVEASVEMALPLVFSDATTRNRAYSMFWRSKRPLK